MAVPNFPKIAVMGAGAVGCFYGGMLARAGHDVTFIGRPVHVEAINAHGLLIEMKGSKAHVKARAATEPSAAAGADLVLVCVKSADSGSAGSALKPVIGRDTLLVSLQNGVDNAERISAAVGREVIPAAVYVGAEMGGPGHVVHHGRGELLIGASPKSAELAKTLTAAGIPTTVSETIAQALWAKLVVNSAYNAMSAVAQLPYGAMLQSPGTRETMADIVTECMAVAKACGVALPADTLQKTLAVATQMPNQYSSTAQDLARGKPTEIEYLNGHIVRKGAEHGIATPANRALLVMTRLAEKGRAAAASKA